MIDLIELLQLIIAYSVRYSDREKVDDSGRHDNTLCIIILNMLASYYDNFHTSSEDNNKKEDASEADQLTTQ